MSSPLCASGFTQSVEIVVSTHNVPALVTALTDRIDRFTSTYSGFVGACVLVSESQDEVQMLLSWISKDHGEQALSNAKDGEPDLFQIANDFQASSMSFRTFVVAAELRL